MEVRAMMMEAFARETVAYGEPTNPNVRVKYQKSVDFKFILEIKRSLIFLFYNFDPIKLIVKKLMRSNTETWSSLQNNS